MSKYLELLNKAEKCEKTALELLHAKKNLMAVFYRNAAIGYKNKAKRLNIKEIDEDDK